LIPCFARQLCSEERRLPPGLPAVVVEDSLVELELLLEEPPQEAITTEMQAASRARVTFA
jgi:hypothetical protein